DPDADIEADPPPGTAPGAGTGAGAGCRTGFAAAARAGPAQAGHRGQAAARPSTAADRRGEDRLALLEEEGAAVPRQPQAGRPARRGRRGGAAAREAAADPARRVTAPLGGRWGRAGGDRGHPLAVILDRVDRGRPPPAAAAEPAGATRAAGGSLRGDEDHGP